MMKAQHWLQVDLAVLTILGTALLGSGQQSISLTLLMLVAAPAAVVCTDIYQWFRLSRSLANLAAIGSVGYAVFQFFSSGIDNQLLSVANLLVYLQLILLFQEKSHRLNWQLLVLSLLEVVVSAAMNMNFRFFILLLIYLVCAQVAMALLFLLREASRFERKGLDRQRGMRISDVRRLTCDVADPTLRWLHGASVTMVSAVSPPALIRELARSGYLQQVGLFGCVTLTFATVLFYSTPRLGGTNWQGGRGKGQPTVGFSRQVSLDEMGEILQSDELALRISFFDHQTNEPLRSIGQPYIRGGVLTRYGDAPYVGRWSVARSSRGRPLQQATDLEGLVRQEVWLEPTADPAVFGIFPLARIPGIEPPLRYDSVAEELRREPQINANMMGRFRYVLGSYGFREGWQCQVTPYTPRATPAAGNGFVNDELSDCLSFSPRAFPTITQLAEQILREANATDAGTLQKARVLEQHFLQPELYQYSLRFRQARNRRIDPIEDFVANHRTGHCEYFATALVLMLRSQGIPARLVVGYHGGEYNTLGNYFLVRQRDAHAWVEVLLDSEEVKQIGKSSLPHADVSQGGWLRLDPTPGDSLTPEASDGVVWNRFDDVMEYAEFLWNDYVTGLNRDRQRQTLSAPLWDRLIAWLGAIVDPEQWRQWSAATLSKWLRRWGIVNELGGFGWRMIVGVLVLVVMAILVARPLVALAKYLGRGCLQVVAIGWNWVGSQLRRSRGGRVEFYERLERLLARKGLRRLPQQTPREFLQAVEVSAPVDVHRQLWRDAAWQVVEAFYRVRFGNAALDKAETNTIEQALECVAAGLEGRSLSAVERSS